MRTMEPSTNSLLGAYGSCIGGLGAEGPGNRGIPEYSFLNPEWTDIDSWRREAGRQFATHLLAPKLGSPRVEITAKRNYDGLIIEELSWSFPCGPVTRAWFLKPENAPGRLPGVLAFHDHGGNKYFGKEKIACADADGHPSLTASRQLYYGGRPWANELAKRGYGVLVHDIFPFGSRKILPSDLPGLVVDRMMLPPEEVRELEPKDVRAGRVRTDFNVSDAEPQTEIDRYNAFAGQHEAIIAKAIFSVGHTWPGFVLAEDTFALDYLCSRADIDPDRLGCSGLSGGGLRTNYLAGSDPRIRCSVTAGFMTTWTDFALHTAYTHTWMIYIPGLPRYMDFPDILSMRAPLPALVLANRQDPLFSVDEVLKAESILKAAWKKAGEQEKFRFSWYDGPHQFNTAMQDEAFTWFDHHLT